MTDEELQELWVYARGTWPSFTVSEFKVVQSATLLAWRDHLGDLDQAVVRAAMCVLGESDFIPALGKIRRAALELISTDTSPALDQAWGEVMAAVGTCGRSRAPQWSHPTVADTVRSLGWITICDARTDQMSIIRGQFAKMYATVAERHYRDTQPMSPALAQFTAATIQRVDDVLMLGGGDR